MRLERNAAKRRGGAACRNAGLSLATGEYIVFLDSDDALSPECLANRVELMDQNRELDFMVFPSRVFSQQPGDSELFWNGFDDRDDLERFLRQDMPWQTTGPIWRRESLARAKLAWDERAESWQDWEFHIRALALGLRYKKVPKPDCYYRCDWKRGMTNSSFAPSKVFNRARMLCRLAAFFEAQGAATTANRRLLAAHLFRHAFCSGMRKGRAGLIWRMGYKSGLVNAMSFYSVVLSRTLIWLTARITRSLERRAVPESGAVHVGTHLKATEPWLKARARENPAGTALRKHEPAPQVN
jgi:glycosyltransferase involved in cell wall biosynthesis